MSGVAGRRGLPHASAASDWNQSYVRRLLVAAEDCLVAALQHVGDSRQLTVSIARQRSAVHAIRTDLENGVVAGDPVDAWAPLTERQRQYAIRVARGESNATIAAELGVSIGTANNMIARMLNKLEMENRVQLSTWVIADATRRIDVADRELGSVPRAHVLQHMME